VEWDEAAGEHYQSARSAATLWLPARGVVVPRARGYGDLGIVRFYTARVDRVLLANPQLRMRAFHHWLDVDRFDSKARAHLRTWADQQAKSLADAHYLVSSRILAMAISAAALALGRNLVAHTDEEKFEAVLDEAIRASSALPASAVKDEAK
jgi:phage protein D